MPAARPVELREVAVNDARVKSSRDEMVAMGLKIRLGRENLGMIQPEMAKALGVSESTVSNWERGLSTPKNKMGPLLRLLQVSSLDEIGRPTPLGDSPTEPDGVSEEEFLRSVDNSLLLAEISRRFAHLPKQTTTGKPGRKWRILRDEPSRTGNDARPDAAESSG